MPSLENPTDIPVAGTLTAELLPLAPMSKGPRVFLRGSGTPLLFRNVQEIAKTPVPRIAF